MREMALHPVTVKFQVIDLHPGRGRKHECVFEETLQFMPHVGNFAIVPEAGKHYTELMKRFNGQKGKFLWGKCRYEVNYHII